ncbi:MAG: hypothetical protein J6T94_06815 [Bacteroidaceae bacterium]|nr:hypothetical protein [Bacteroidaceae bacterium]
MKKILFALVAMMVTLSAFAQGPQRGERREFKPEEMATRQADRIKQACNIDDKQYDKLYNLFLNQSKEMQKQMQAGEGQRMSREDMQKRFEEREKAIKAILTDEQVKAYDKMQQEQRQRRGNGGQRGGQRGPRPERQQ